MLKRVDAMVIVLHLFAAVDLLGGASVKAISGLSGFETQAILALSIIFSHCVYMTACSSNKVSPLASHNA